MPAQLLRALRVVGLPTPMATTAIPAVLRTERGVREVDVVDTASVPTALSESPASSSSAVVEIVVDAAAFERVRDKLINSFAAVCVDEIAVPPRSSAPVPYDGREGSGGTGETTG